jgi:hypothetical protein
MSRKHYKVLAEALRQTKPRPTAKVHMRQWIADVIAIADSLKEDNIRFNRDRFYTACEMTFV